MHIFVILVHIILGALHYTKKLQA